MQKEREQRSSHKGYRSDGKAHTHWQEILSLLSQKINPDELQTWFAPIHPLKYESPNLFVELPSKFIREQIEKRYLKVLGPILSEKLGKGRLKYVLKRREERVKQQPKPSFRQEDIKIIPQTHRPFQTVLNPRYTLDNFITGSINQLARVAAYLLVKNPKRTPFSTSFNPLLVHGQVGLGKTHLLQAIGNELSNSTNKVAYVPSGEFGDQFVSSVRNKTINTFVSSYFSTEVLILDDIQFLSGKEKTQEIFFHIFNHLHQRGKQIVLSSDTPPKDLMGVEERLLSRFKSGLTVPIEPPDLDTRREIIQFKAQQDDVFLSDEVIEYLATRLCINVREMEGVLASLIAQSVLQKKEIDVALASVVVDRLVRPPKAKKISISDIQHKVSEYFRIPQKELLSKSRKKELTVARQMAIYLCKKRTASAIKDIGQAFGQRDHSTILYSVKKMEKELKKDSEVKQIFREISRNL